MFQRIIILVMDSVGIGAQHDADQYQSAGANTFQHAAQAYPNFSVPTLQSLGIGNIPGVDMVPSTSHALAHYGRMIETTSGNDTFAGIWEMAGVVFKERFASFRPKMPDQLVDELRKSLGISTLCNAYVSGFKVLDQFADEHFASGLPIVYTCDDGCILVAAHEDVIEPSRLQDIAQKMATFFVGRNVTRIIARPFVGTKGNFVRTDNRADILVPLSKTREHLFHRVRESGISLTMTEHLASIIGDDFSGNILPGVKDSAGIMDSVCEHMKTGMPGISMFVVPDFDMSGHRRDPQQYALDIMYFDERLPEVLRLLGSDDILFIVADHGCDPALDIRGHTREYIPLLVVNGDHGVGSNLGTRASFADLGQTICNLIETRPITIGQSFSHHLHKEG